MASGRSRPSIIERNACNSKRNPAPPASTTPASRRTSSCSGVRSSAASPSSSASSTVRSIDPSLAASCAALATSRTTVRIVPSTGFITEPSAAMLASLRATASTFASISSACAKRLLIPLSTCDKMTPEFPRAPINDPCEMAVHTADLSFASTPFNSSNTDATVKNILVPVSPSGTG